VDRVLIFPGTGSGVSGAGGVWPYYRALRERSYDVVLDFQACSQRVGHVFESWATPDRVPDCARGCDLLLHESVALPPELPACGRQECAPGAGRVRGRHPTPRPELVVDAAAVQRADRTDSGPRLTADRSAGHGARLTLGDQDLAAGLFRRRAGPGRGAAAAYRVLVAGNGRRAAGGRGVTAACRTATPGIWRGDGHGTLVELLRRSAALLTNDSGPMHLAAV